MKMLNGTSTPPAGKKDGFGDLSRHAQIRCSVIEEIIRREKDYLKILHYAVDVIKAELENCCEKIEFEIEDGHVRALFGNMADILEVHENLLKSLESAVGSEVAVKDEEYYRKMSEAIIGGIFVKMRDSFKAYDIYCSNHARAEKVASDIIQMTTLKSKRQKWTIEGPFSESTSNDATMFTAILSEPLRYICNLAVLLKILAVFTPPALTDLDDVITAIQVARAAVTSIDAAKRGQLLQNAYELCDAMQKTWDERDLCNKNGFLTKRGGSVKNWKIRWFTLRGYELKYFDEPIDEKALTTLDLHLCSAVVDNESQSKPNCFGLVFSERTYYMYGISASEKAEWVNLISWKIFVTRSAEERARLALASPAQQKPTVLQLLKC